MHRKKKKIIIIIIIIKWCESWIHPILDKFLPQHFHWPLPLLEEDSLGCKHCDRTFSISKRRRTFQLDSGKKNMKKGIRFWNVGDVQTTLAPVLIDEIGHCPKYLLNLVPFAPDRPAGRGFHWGSFKKMLVFFSVLRAQDRILCYNTSVWNCGTHGDVASSLSRDIACGSMANHIPSSSPLFSWN